MDLTSVGRGGTLARARGALASEPRTALGQVVVGLVALWMVFDVLVGLATGSLAFSNLAELLWDGLMRGLVIGLAGVGLSLTYSILNFANFSHGDYVTTGAFAGWGVTYLIAGLGTAPAADLLLVGAAGDIFGSQLGITATSTPLAVLAGVVVAGVAAVALSLAIDRLVYEPMRAQTGITLLIASVGVAFALRYLVVFAYTTARRGTTALGSIAGVDLVFIDGTVGVSAHDVTLVAVTVSLMVGVHLLLQRTKLGKAMRAMADNEDLARVTGIPTERVVTWTWVIGGGLAGVAGYVLVLWTGTISFQFGWVLLLLIFAAVILGGIGSIYGAIFGGVVIGLAMNLSTLWIPTDFARATAFAVMILILLFRPEGLFAGRSTA